MTVGYFAVEDGTQNAAIPCLNEELGVDNGSNVRHRAFFIVDRSVADEYDGPDSAPATLEAMDVLVLPNKVTFIE